MWASVELKMGEGSVILRAAGYWLALAIALWTSVASGADTAPKRSVRLPGPSDAEPRTTTAPAAPRKPTDFKSAHFLLHTDLRSKEAHELLNRLEVMLSLIARYWGQPPVGVIECYVVDDLAAWPPGSLPEEGRAKIAQSAGVTSVKTVNRGAKVLSAKAIVYAKYGAHPLADGAGDRGTPQHEAVHAYCGQVFGRTGPLWYAEGMAEMGRYWHPGDNSVHCDSIVVDYIRATPARPLGEIVSERGAPRTGDSWQNYAWRWALCHMLENNPNYTARFRALGLAYLNGAPAHFADTFAGMLEEIAFEYRFFLAHFDQGYRVDLCSWDWKRKFKPLASGASVAARVNAQRGWQPSGVIVEPGEKYQYRTSGTWQLSKGGGQLSADGESDGRGRLEAVVLRDFLLSRPFALGVQGSFEPPDGGQLYVRCRDDWNSLADNRGAVSVKLTRVATSDAGADVAARAASAAAGQ